jgi:hypothetical protein
MHTLEQACLERSIEPFTQLLAHLVHESMEGRPVAVV